MMAPGFFFFSWLKVGSNSACSRVRNDVGVPSRMIVQ